MKAAIMESQRRRVIQLEFNATHDITPQGIQKPFRERMIEKKEDEGADSSGMFNTKKKGEKRDEPLIINLNKAEQIDLNAIQPADLTPSDKQRLAAKLRRRMLIAANDMDFELATILRDTISKLN
jgi:excinuclease ABC subunit B